MVRYEGRSIYRLCLVSRVHGGGGTGGVGSLRVRVVRLDDARPRHPARRRRQQDVNHEHENVSWVRGPLLSLDIPATAERS